MQYKKPKRNFIFDLLGAVVGSAQMGICVAAAAYNGNLKITPAQSVNIPIFIFALLAVFIQASAEEVESRGFVFGKMFNEGVPYVWAVVVSSISFSYLHATNPGFGWLAFSSIFVAAAFYAVSCYYFNTIWFAFTAHMMWNFTQDFIFGLPNSGRPAAVSLFNTVVEGSGFFYDKTFGIEGSVMALLVDVLSCVAVILIGRYIRKKKNKLS